MDIFITKIKKLGVILLLILSVLACAKIGWFIGTSKTQVAVVTRVEVKKGIYMIYTDKGVYKNIDSFIGLKFNSGDIYGKIITGKTYEIKSSGIRSTFTSSFPNILKLTLKN